MTKKITLKARSKGAEEKNPKAIRKAGEVPAIVYGPGIENYQIIVDHVEMEKAFAEAGESTLIELQVDGKASHKAIIKDIDFDGLKHRILHVDFFQVNMKNPVEVEIPFVFTGVSAAESDKEAMIIHNATSLNVRCLPGDLMDNIEIDLSRLKEIGDAIRVSDLSLPDTFEVLSEPDEVIVIASEHEEVPAEEAAAPVEAAAAPAAPAEKK